MAKNHTTKTRIARAKSGDREAFDELVAELRPRLIAFAQTRLGPDLRSRTEPEDIVQDTVVRALQSFERFEWRGENSLFNWFASILEYRIRDLSRARQRTGHGRLEIDPATDSVSASQAVRREERLERLEAALGSLNEAHREVVRLVRFEELSFVEVGTRIGRSPGAVRQLFLRALEKLRESFGPETESLCLPERGVDFAEAETDD